MSTLNTKFSKFYIQGLHCASCQILIERRLIKIPEIQSVDVSIQDSILTVEHLPFFKITPQYLNRLFVSDNYLFSPHPFLQASSDSGLTCNTPPALGKLKNLLITLIFIFGFLLLNRSGFSSLISVNNTSSLPLFFTFGLLAGFSSCAALTGGIILSLSQQWSNLYKKSDSFLEKSTPHFLFNGGRVISYLVFGAILGALGNFFRFSPLFTASVVILVSLGMVFLGLQMLGVKTLSRFQISLPKSLTGRLSDETNFQGKWAPALMGALTFFLPCGFTITAQALALSSGSPLRGAAILGLFSLGTLPGLLAIGLSSVKLYANPVRSRQFSSVAGLLVLFFAAFNINAQAAVLGAPNLDSLIRSQSSSLVGSVDNTLLPEMVNGVQIVRIKANSQGYTPNYIKVRAGVPIRWEITDTGTSGCTNAIISRQLFDGRIDLVPGTTSVKEFTIPNAGKYRFSCWMGMVTGFFDAVDASGSSVSTSAFPADSGAQGCGCGGGSAGASCH